MTRLERAALPAGGTLLLAPGAITDGIGAALIACVVARQWYAGRRARGVERASVSSRVL